MTAPTVTTRAWLAAEAPDEIPAWFKHTQPEKKLPPLPTMEGMIEDHIKTCKNWLDDPCHDLPEELQWFQKDHKDHYAALAAWHELNNRERYFQWRLAFADEIIKRGAQ